MDSDIDTHAERAEAEAALGAGARDFTRALAVLYRIEASEGRLPALRDHVDGCVKRACAAAGAPTSWIVPRR